MNAKLKSGIATAAIVLLSVLLMSLNIFAYTPPDPPIPEEGVEVNLGDSDFGQGDSPEPASEAANYAPPASQQQVVTQRTEPTVPVPSSPNPGNVTNPAAQEQPVVENKEPEINKNALFPGKRNQTSGGGSQGVSTGQGNQGNPNGTPTSNNYNGNGGGNGNYNLKGRSAVVLPKPEYNSNQQGKIVVRIWVDQQGRVVRTEAPYQGSTITTGSLVEQAKAAAKRARFNASTSAPEEQIGTITYIFKI